MFRAMRRSRQQLPLDECEFILNRNTSGVLSVIGDDGYPYGIPLSYVFKKGKIYFHCALEGHKIDAIKKCDKVSFCVIDQDDVKPAEFTTYYRSMIAFGRARIVEPEEKMKVLDLLEEKYAHGKGDYQKELASFDSLHVIELTIEDMKGKAAKEISFMTRPILKP